MSDETGFIFPTLDEARINDPHLRQDWLWVGRFELSLVDRANLLYLGRELEKRFTRRSYDLLNERDERRHLKALHLIIRPDPEIAIWCDKTLGPEDSNHRLDDETYWELVEELCRKHWDDATLVERVDLADAADLPISVILSATMPPEVGTRIYQEYLDD